MSTSRCRATRLRPASSQRCRDLRQHPLLAAATAANGAPGRSSPRPQTAAELMLTEFPEVRHVYLASGSCLPLRPVRGAGGLSRRPAAHRLHRKRDDRGCRPGPSAGSTTNASPCAFRSRGSGTASSSTATSSCSAGSASRRRIPKGLVPHLGSQWWCLTRQTLSAILQDPDRAGYDRYFKRVWIPDESYFQTLVRLYSHQCRKPLADAVASSTSRASRISSTTTTCSFCAARTASSRARSGRRRTASIDAFLAGDGGACSRQPSPTPARSTACSPRRSSGARAGGPGLYMQSRFPNENWENGRTCAPYSVFEGFSRAVREFRDLAVRRPPAVRVHGHLFAPERVAVRGRRDGL